MGRFTAPTRELVDLEKALTAEDAEDFFDSAGTDSADPDAGVS
jgi:hypothetical protein